MLDWWTMSVRRFPHRMRPLQVPIFAFYLVAMERSFGSCSLKAKPSHHHHSSFQSPIRSPRLLKNHACQNDTTTTNARMTCSCTVPDSNNTPKGLLLYVRFSLLLLFTPMAVTRSYNYEHHQPASRAGIQPLWNECGRYSPKSEPTLSMPSKRSFPNARP